MASRHQAMVVVACMLACASCGVLVDFDGYRSQVAEPGDAGPTDAEPPDTELEPLAVTVFQSFWFQRDAAAFPVSAADGLSRPPAVEGRTLVPGSFETAKGGGLELEASGSFVYRPPGAPGAFWGDDYVEYTFAGEPAVRGRARLTVQPLGIDLTEIAASSGAGFGVAGGSLDQVGSTVAGLSGARHRPFAPAGDVNGDGLEDFVIGALGPWQTDSALPYGEGHGAYVLFGKRDASNVSLAELSGSFPPKGFAIIDDEVDDDADSLGYSVAGAGDVNGDGLDDIVIGSHSFNRVCRRASPDCNHVGAAYVIFGKQDSETVRCEHLRSAGGGGFAIVPSYENPSYLRLGLSVDKAGDVNGDGLGDVIVGVASYAPNGGSVFGPAAISAPHVIFGKQRTDPVRLEDVTSGEGGGFAILASAQDLDLGNHVAGVGDVNGDGLDDVAMSSENYPNSDHPRGRVLVVLGKNDTRPVLVSDIEAGSGEGYFLLGVDDGDRTGTPVYGGDVNGDGFDDIVIASPYATLVPLVTAPQPDAQPSDAGVALDAGIAVDAAAGQVDCPSPPCPDAEEEPEFGVVYVVYGKREIGDILLQALENYREGSGPALGLTLSGGNRFQHIGHSASSGDINGDGLNDVIASREPTARTGEAYVAFGRRSTTSAESDPWYFIAMWAYTAEQACGIVVSGADTNGDGFDDLLASSQLYADAPPNAGGAYVAFGWDFTQAQAGRDVALLGGPGDDDLSLPETTVMLVKGGHGRDTLKPGSSTGTLDLTPPGRYQSLEVIDVRGGGPQDILLNDAAVRRLPENQAGYAFGLARRLVVLGDADDRLHFDATGYAELGVTQGGRVYGRTGAHYGLEVSLELLPFAAP